MRKNKQSEIMYFNTENYVSYRCAYCGQKNVTEIDISMGFVQEYIDDCQVCCCPNTLKIMFNEISQSLDIDVTYSG